MILYVGERNPQCIHKLMTYMRLVGPRQITYLYL